jgi:hypothetical protein
MFDSDVVVVVVVVVGGGGGVDVCIVTVFLVLKMIKWAVYNK